MGFFRKWDQKLYTVALVTGIYNEGEVGYL